MAVKEHEAVAASSAWGKRYDQDGRCVACTAMVTLGSKESQLSHRRRHVEMIGAVHGAHTEGVGDGVLVSTPDMSLPVQRAAFAVGARFRRECGIDFACNPVSVPFPSPRPTQGYVRYRERSFVAVRGGWAVGLVVTRKRGQHSWQGRDGVIVGADVDTVPGACWAIDAVYTLPSFRRCGIARDTLRHAAGVYGIELEDFAWEGPLRGEGLALALNVAGGPVRLSFGN